MKVSENQKCCGCNKGLMRPDEITGQAQGALHWYVIEIATCYADLENMRKATGFEMQFPATPQGVALARIMGPDLEIAAEFGQSGRFFVCFTCYIKMPLAQLHENINEILKKRQAFEQTAAENRDFEASLEEGDRRQAELDREHDLAMAADE